MKEKFFLPTNKKELDRLGWKQCDIIIVSGDAYVDHPSFGTALVSRYLQSLGYKVGIIAQPNWKDNDEDFLALGLPKLFVGITAGNLDSMLAHYTANKKIRSDDAYTAGNKHGLRPNRATIVYCNKIKHLMPGIPVVIGGIESSMRRLAHYDYWSDSIRKSIILDSKADILVYGMAEKALKEISLRLSEKKPLNGINGTVIYLAEKEFQETEFLNSTMINSYEEIIADKDTLLDCTKTIEENQNPYSGKTLIQKHDKKYVVCFPPSMPLSSEELDNLYNLPFMRLPHPVYSDTIPAFDMIKESITILRGCPGGCAFCSIGFHQGKLIQSRSEDSIYKEIRYLSRYSYFKGIVTDLGGPTANLYKMGCSSKKSMINCKRPSCLFPNICKNFNTNADKLIDLMKKARKIEKIKKVHISSGIRFDVALESKEYIEELLKYHVSGHLKLAPESFDDEVLKLMRKPKFEVYKKFVKLYNSISRDLNKRQFILPYLISSFPGCSDNAMIKTRGYLKDNRLKVEQTQDFIPLPMTVAAAMYYSGRDYCSRQNIYIAKTFKQREKQRNLLAWWKNN